MHLLDHAQDQQNGSGLSEPPVDDPAQLDLACAG